MLSDDDGLSQPAAAARARGGTGEADQSLMDSDKPRVICCQRLPRCGAGACIVAVPWRARGVTARQRRASDGCGREINVKCGSLSAPGTRYTLRVDSSGCALSSTFPETLFPAIRLADNVSEV